MSLTQATHSPGPPPARCDRLQRHRALASALGSVLGIILLFPGALAAQIDGKLSPKALRLTSSRVCDPTQPVLAAHKGAGFAAAWLDEQVHAGLFDRFAARRAPETVRGTVGKQTPAPRLAVARSGVVALGWIEGDGPHLQLLDPDGRIRTEDLLLGGPVLGSFPQLDAGEPEPEVFDLIADPEGGFLALWLTATNHVTHIDENGEVQALDLPAPLISSSSFRAALHPDGHLWWIEHQDLPTSPPSSILGVSRTRLTGAHAFEIEKLFETTAVDHRQAAIAIDARGGVVIAWNQDRGIFGLRFDADGAPLGPPFEIGGVEPAASSRDTVYGLDLEVDAEGNFAVVWGRLFFASPGPSFAGSAIFLRGFGAAGAPLGPVREVASVPFDQLLSPRVAITGPGEVTVAWWHLTILPILPPACSFSEAIFVRRLPLAGDGPLLLGDGRFRVAVSWEDPFNGGTGVGHAIPDTTDSGAFWFFDPANTELRVKVLDAGVINGRFWFFYGALTNVAYHITVTDQRTGASKGYDNPAGKFGSFADTSAFTAP